MRVLFCCDGSQISYQAIENFSKWNSDIVVDIICAIDWSFLPDTVAIEDSEFGHYCANSATTILDNAENRLKELGLNVDKKIKVCGSSVEAILEVLDNSSYDLVVLGSNGKKGIQKWLGSVSQEIASSSPISTYISKFEKFPNKVLFAIEPNEYSYSFISKSIELLDLSNKDIYLCTVYEMPDYLFLEGNLDSHWFLDIETKQESAAVGLLNKYERLFNDSNLSIMDKIVLKGTPNIEINKTIKNLGVDLVICGTREKKSKVKFLTTSVSKRVLEDATCDVLIIK